MNFLNDILNKTIVSTLFSQKNKEKDNKDKNVEKSQIECFSLPTELILQIIQFLNIEDMTACTRISKKFSNTIYSVLPKYVNNEIYRKNSRAMQSASFEDLAKFYIRISNIGNASTTQDSIEIADFSYRSSQHINLKLLKTLGKTSKTIKKLVLSHVELFTKTDNKYGFSTYVSGTGLYLDSGLTKKSLKTIMENFKQLEVLEIGDFEEIDVAAIFDSVLKHPTLKTVITRSYTIDLTPFKQKTADEIKTFCEITRGLKYSVWSGTLKNLNENKITCLSNITLHPSGLETFKEDYHKNHLKITSKIKWFMNPNKIDDEIDRFIKLFELKKNFDEIDISKLLSLKESSIEKLISLFNKTEATTFGLTCGAGADTNGEPGLHLTPLFSGHRFINGECIIKGVFNIDETQSLLMGLFQTNFLTEVKNLSLRFDDSSWFGKIDANIYCSNMEIVIPSALESFPMLETLSFCGMHCVEEVVNPLLEKLCDPETYPNLRAITITQVDYTKLNFKTLLDLHKKRPHLHLTITKNPNIKSVLKVDYVGNYGDTVEVRKQIGKFGK
jgi:hypothetical protein